MIGCFLPSSTPIFAAAATSAQTHSTNLLARGILEVVVAP
jgi:hypothetical protein